MRGRLTALILAGLVCGLGLFPASSLSYYCELHQAPCLTVVSYGVCPEAVECCTEAPCGSETLCVAAPLDLDRFTAPGACAVPEAPCSDLFPAACSDAVLAAGASPHPPFSLAPDPPPPVAGEVLALLQVRLV